MFRYLCTTAILIGTLGVASAQQLPVGGGSFVGTTQDQPGCPAATLHILRSGQTLVGTVMYVNGTGMSSVHGQTDGKTLSFTMISVEGKGPTGQVTGTISPEGRLQIQKVGTDCTFATYLPALRPEYLGTGQGGR
jgi:hypothetical protein